MKITPLHMWFLIVTLYRYVDEMLDPEGYWKTTQGSYPVRRLPVYYRVEALHKAWWPKIEAEKKRVQAEKS